MRGLFYVLSAMAVMGLAFWAYRENYQTQQSLRDMRDIRNEIADVREALGIQRAEWAYLNRPERLRELAELNFDKLELMPLRAMHFGELEQVAYPAPELPELTDITGQVEVRGTISEQKP